MARSNRRRQGSVIRIHEEKVDEISYTRKKKVKLIPRNIAQEEYVLALHDPSQRIVFALGPAGTGKSYLATQKAISEFKEGRVQKIIITRPTVEAGEKIGYLPGDINRKLEPWTRPIFDTMEEYYSPKEIKGMLEEGVIEIAPLAFMRGRTFKNAIIIFDEAQNATDKQILMCLTRIGEGSRMFVTGDLKQSDLRGENGLADFLRRYRHVGSNMISVVEFKREHVERDPIVEEVLRFYGEE